MQNIFLWEKQECTLGLSFENPWTIQADLHPKKWRPQTWGLTHHLFIGDRTPVLKRGMSPLAIVKGFDVLKSGTSGLCACLKGLPFNTFPFETREETLHRCIIVAVSGPTHTGDHAFLPQEGLIALTGVGATTITVMQ